ncbi:MAG TPA: DUF5677 domain-containing protein [Steroidobacteraceae bacterium]|nr:DUF5677 domain-containing protein [Steroidobacteraceae bacterium]
MRVVLDAAATLGHNEGELQVLALAIYGTVVELFSACVGLAVLGEPTAVPGILRSMFESHVDLDNLLHESGYIEHIHASGFEQTLKVMEASSLRQAFKDGRKAEYDELSAKLADLKCRGKGPLKIWQRCKRAGRLEEYEGLYGLFCIDAHNNTPALAERHISEKPDGGMLVSFFGPYDPWAVIRRLDVGLSLLFRAARDMHGAFQVPAPRVDALAAALDQMKANRVASQQNGT